MADPQSIEIRSRPRPACLLCGAPGEPLYRDLADHLFGAPGRWSLKQCPQQQCGLVWLDPMPVQEDLGKAYQRYYTHNEDPSRGGAAEALLQACYRMMNAIPSRLTGLHMAKRGITGMYLERDKAGKLLDVGCGNGRFMRLMRQSGWEVEGVDFDPRAVEQAARVHGLKVHLGDLTSVGLPDEHCDAITMNHVIEHVPDPVMLLRECRRVLRRRGRLVATTPNTKSHGAQLLGAEWRGLEPPRHLFLFSPQTLCHCAQRAEFSDVQAWSTAANAEIILAASFEIQAAVRQKQPTGPLTRIQRALRALALQYREQLKLREQPDLGEEAVLCCVK
jgi:2-polyprenyl-3-methyl-5-hydroxy-6-metoxy-1,4-benzoquinol methylase